MNELYKKKMLLNAEKCFGELLIRRSSKLKELSQLKNHDLNPLLDIHKAVYAYGADSHVNLARALIIPSIIGTGLNTSFGNIIQKDYLLKFDNDKASGVSGLDIEFHHATDNLDIYCQLKAGVNTINADDVKPILNKFNKAINLIRTNGGPAIPQEQVIVGVFSGKYENRNGHYKKIENSNHPVLVGKDFWEAITGEESFYDDLAITLQDYQRKHSNHTSEIEDAVKLLANELTKV